VLISRIARSLKYERRKMATPEEAHLIVRRKEPVYVKDCQESPSDGPGGRLALRSHVQRRGNHVIVGRRVHKSDCISSLGIPMRSRGTEERNAPRDLYTSKERQGGSFFSALAIPFTQRVVKQLCGDSASFSPIRSGLAISRAMVPSSDLQPATSRLEDTGEASRSVGATVSCGLRLKMR
jgi:hypothetical protein